MIDTFTPIQFKNDKLILLDQRKLPLEEVFVDHTSLEDCYISIRDMVVRGAPCIGFTAIYALGLWLKNHKNFIISDFIKAADYLRTARPTAVNLNFEIDRVILLVKDDINNNCYERVIEFGHKQIKESGQNNLAMAKLAQKDLNEKLDKKMYKILTHCNTGFLACGSMGTALGVIENLYREKQLEMTWVDETRPYLQGSRLTAYELSKLEAPFNIVVEGAASYLMANGLVDAIFTGADRIVANGDSANKVGTANLAIIAKYYGVPFYIVAPSSTFDLSLESGSEIEIEMRDEAEILKYQNLQIAPMSASGFNPSFDVTPGELISGIISEKGISHGNYKVDLPRIVQ